MSAMMNGEHAEPNHTQERSRENRQEGDVVHILVPAASVCKGTLPKDHFVVSLQLPLAVNVLIGRGMAGFETREAGDVPVRSWLPL
jgi:hypothetical protein